jgi:hypothetical protein
MCLSQPLAKPWVQQGCGYKVFRQDNKGRLRPAVLNTQVEFTPGAWVTDPCERLLRYPKDTSTTIHYKTGFHLFEQKRDAFTYAKNIDYYWEHWYTSSRSNVFILSHTIRKVWFTDVTAFGRGLGLCRVPVIVARRMKILEVVE